MSEIWTKWEGQIVNGVFPLRRFLGGSDQSGVFLTESKARNLPNAALKLIPDIPSNAEAQLSHWTTAAASRIPICFDFSRPDGVIWVVCNFSSS